MKNYEIYNKLAKRYDIATKIVSFGIEEWWRKLFKRRVLFYLNSLKKRGDKIALLDVASATGDMAISLKDEVSQLYLLEPCSEMNKVASKKLNLTYHNKDKNRIVAKSDKIVIIEDFAEDVKLDKKVDFITAFMAVRNFDELERGIRNLDSCLKSGGYFAIMELTRSDSLLFKMSSFYMSKVVPLLGGLITGEYESYKKFDTMIKSITDEQIIDSFQNYQLVERKRVFPPIASIIIMRKNG